MFFMFCDVTWPEAESRPSRRRAGGRDGDVTGCVGCSAVAIKLLPRKLQNAAVKIKEMLGLKINFNDNQFTNV